MSPTRELRNWRTRRSLARSFGALALAFLAALAMAPSPAQAIGTLNSKCEPGAAGFAIVSYGGEWAQTFSAGRSGKLLTVDVKGIARQPEGTGDINVKLYGVNETGAPAAPALASTTIPSPSIPTDAYAHDYTANFNSETAFYLEAGKTYAIGIGSASPKQDSWNLHGGNLCSPGELLVGPSPFHPWNGETGWDAGLVTYLGPANDDFERAQELTGQNAGAESTTAGGTRQVAEPDHYVTNPPDSYSWEGDHTVWFRWTAPNTGPTTIDTCTGEIDSILAVYTGSALNALTRVTDNNNDPACSTADIYGSKVGFEAVGGTTYYIAVGDAGGAREKSFALNIVGSPDMTPPETQIDSGPSGQTTNASPAFTFSSSEAGSTFECRLDSTEESAFQACSSPRSYSSLSLGPHTFEVRATDEAENVDSTPASRTFTVEPPPNQGGSTPNPGAGSPPNSFIRKAKINQAKDTAIFRFGSSEDGATFLCKLDGKPFKRCRSPKTYRNLKPGKHRFQLKAVDVSGETDPTPAVRKFRIKP